MSFVVCVPSFGSQAQNYGLGGSSSGRVNSVTAELDNPYAALYNPALLSAQSGSLFGFSTAIQQTRFSSSQNIAVPNHSLSTWALGLSLPFRLASDSHRHAGFGIALSGPYEKLRSFTAYRPDDAFVMRYGASDSQFKASLAGSLEIWEEHLFLGGGVSLYLNTAGSAEQNITGAHPDGRMALDVGLNTAAIAGLYFQKERTQTSFTYHQALDPSFVQAIDGNVEIGGSNTLHQPLIARSTLYYEPHSFEWEAQYDLGPFKTSVGLAYELWKNYKAPILITEALDNNGGTRATEMPRVPLRNTFNPRASIEVPFWENRLLWATGYQFRPTPVEDLSGGGNFLDTSAHVLGVSLSQRTNANALIPWNLRWGLYGQYHFLNSRTVTKQTGTVNGANTYVFRGNAAVYGIYLQTEL